MNTTIYTDGTYRDSNPNWHMADSGWKAGRVTEIVERNGVSFETCVEVGCGAGLIVELLAETFPDKQFVGFDVSPDAARLWPARKRPEMYRHEDFAATVDRYDLLLLLDVFEHVPDYLGFLRSLSPRAKWFVFHIPLEMHVSGLLRDRHLHARRQVGHLHYFSRATALATLADTGYEVVDSQFTKLSQETVENVSPLTRVTNLARRGIAAVAPDLAAKLLGGYSLLALCRATDERH